MWGIGRGTKFSSAGAFFVLMGIVERVWQRTTGTRVQGFWGWAWTMVWTVFRGTFMLDVWARHGLIACDFFMPGLRPGKPNRSSMVSLLATNN